MKRSQVVEPTFESNRLQFGRDMQLGRELQLGR